ncbi:prepilin peptidase [Micromonospora mirobrigensis]|uniref:Leader peptidase (Prepilin peptidase) / N-methyltransferase n=1 Tax=Micromonospora mirobrigensis TaxID=262898 RepID=A0A1C4VKJ9_9ACTN|nr:prepilin peptidase [Micromonospora mirobrigensis]SCE84341.1 leader peptidase (prepilin peptidase) / N-methyltransferase [Micromonospora mirobrigensis]
MSASLAPEPPIATAHRGSALLAVLAVAPACRYAVARYAVPPGTADRMACDGCAAPIRLDRAWPALGPAGRCPGCRRRIGAPPWTVEVALVAALLLVVALADGPPVERFALAWWLAWAVPLVLIDIAVHRLPDRLTWPAAAGTLVLLGVAAWTGPGAGAWLRAAGAAALLAAFFAGTTLLLGRRGFGLGDAKLALGAGALLGWYGWPLLLVGPALACVFSALTGLLLLAARRVRWSSHLPFGPFLLLGTLAALALTW